MLVSPNGLLSAFPIPTGFHAEDHLQARDGAVLLLLGLLPPPLNAETVATSSTLLGYPCSQPSVLCRTYGPTLGLLSKGCREGPPKLVRTACRGERQAWEMVQMSSPPLSRCVTVAPVLIVLFLCFLPSKSEDNNSTYLMVGEG